MRAIIIDDILNTRLILKKILLDFNFEIYEASDGMEGMKCIDNLGFIELALIDWNIPEMDGLEVIKKIRANKIYEKTQIVMITTETDINMVAKALEAGANEYIMKPFTKDMIIEKLHLLGIQKN